MKIEFLPNNVKLIDGKAYIFWKGKRFRYKKGDTVPETASKGSEKPVDIDKA